MSFVKPWKQLGTTWDLNEFREMVVGDMFETALNARLFRRSHSKESIQPFFTASYSNDRVCRNADCEQRCLAIDRCNTCVCAAVTGLWHTLLVKHCLGVPVSGRRGGGHGGPGSLSSPF